MFLSRNLFKISITSRGSLKLLDTKLNRTFSTGFSFKLNTPINKSFNTVINVNKKVFDRVISLPVISSFREKSNKSNFEQNKQEHSNALWYILSGFVIMIGASYAAVPLFKIFCESQGFDANTDFRDMNIETLTEKLKGMKKVENRQIKVKFVASTATDLLWKFEPCQDEIYVAPGETALAFFKARNLTDRSIIGIGKIKLFT